MTRSWFLVLLLLVVTTPLFAQPLPRNEVSVSAGRTEFPAREGAAYGASYARFWRDAISTRIGVFGSGYDFPDEPGGQRFRAVHLDLGLHFRRTRLVSPRVNVGIVRAKSEVTQPYAHEGGSKTTLFGSGGIDFNVHRHVALGAEVSYIDFTTNENDRFPSKLNPLTTLASARFRW